MTAPPAGAAAPAGYGEPADFVAGVLGAEGDDRYGIRRIDDMRVVVAETDRRGVDALVDRPQVAAVVADEPLPPLLDRSLGTLRADDVHNTLGARGNGVSVAMALAAAAGQTASGSPEPPRAVRRTHIERLAGATRIIVVLRGAETDAAFISRAEEQIMSALGPGAVIRALGESSYLAEDRTGFDPENLSRLVDALGSTVRLYADAVSAPM